MAEKKISYLNRTFEDYQTALRNYLQKYYPQIANDFDDASIGSWLVDLFASIGDNLSFHIDRVYNETNIDTAQLKSSVYALARSNGLKIPGPKGSMAEVEFKCTLPVTTENSDYANSASQLGVPNWHFAPKIKAGTRLASKNQYFEVLNDIDFSEQFDYNGVSNRSVMPVTDVNGDITAYTVTKTDVVSAGESKIYKQVINSVSPFMEITLPDLNIMEVKSIIFKIGTDFQSNPSNSEFMVGKEYVPADSSTNQVETYRFFEVDSLLENYRWGDDISTMAEGNQAQAVPEVYTYGYDSDNVTTPTATVVKGEWIPLTQKFITEYTDKGYLKIIFGSGDSAGHEIPECTNTPYAKHQMSVMLKNNFLGKLPPSEDCTMYVLYRVGGGASSNVAKGAINSISYLNAEIGKCILTKSDQETAAKVKASLTVTNTTPSVSGKDAPTTDEIKMMVKYNNASQNRCVTVKDYETRLMMMPSRYGCPFRVSTVEENNKIMMYLLGLDNNGKLSAVLPTEMVSNIQKYLSKYRTINDFIEIKSGRVINISVEVDCFIDKNYYYSDVIKGITNAVKEYMDINSHHLGEDIFIGDLEKEVGKVDGVLNLIELRIYNEYGNKYSQTRTSQLTVDVTSSGDGDEDTDSRAQIDLEASDYVLNSDADTMYEIKYPEYDIRVSLKAR